MLPTMIGIGAESGDVKAVVPGNDDETHYLALLGLMLGSKVSLSCRLVTTWEDTAMWLSGVVDGVVAAQWPTRSLLH